MFEHLPKITEDNLRVVSEKEIDHFKNLLRRCTEVARTSDEAMNCLCESLSLINPYLAKAVKATAYAVAKDLEDHVEPEIAWEAGIITIPGVLAVLRLMDRALEARDIEARFRLETEGR
jgi:hypothetical protein